MNNETQWKILKRTVIYSILLLGVLTCAFPDTEQDSCTVGGTSEIGYLVRCPDGSEVFIPPPQDGADGDAGPQGTAGDIGATGPQGIQGPAGPQGPKGTAGKDAAACTTISSNEGVYIQCPGGESAFIRNGLPGDSGPVGPIGPAGQKGDKGEAGQQGAAGEVGPQGATGPQGLPGEDGKAGLDGKDSVVAVYDPCGDSPDFDEILLKLADGTVLAYFESGSNRFLTTLRPGTYRTTDGSNCVFTLNNDGTIQ